MAARTKTDAERIAELEAKVDDLASLVGRLIRAVDADVFDEPEDALMVWHEADEDKGFVGWWEYGPLPDASGEEA